MPTAASIVESASKHLRIMIAASSSYSLGRTVQELLERFSPPATL